MPGARGRTRSSRWSRTGSRTSTATAHRAPCWRWSASARTISPTAWLEEGALIRDAGRLAGIPGVLIHGRLDLSGPLDTAWELARAWPDAELVAVRDARHQGSDTMRERMLSALDELTQQ